jgi:glycerol-3-phosphate O-acyltransferase
MVKSKWLDLLADEDEADEEERIYTVDDSNRLQLEYYRNNMIHFSATGRLHFLRHLDQRGL